VHRILLTAAVLFVSASAHVALRAQAAPPGPTVWDGAYTEAQAERAQGIFGASCARCHTLTPDGSRPLSGEKFFEGYTQRTVGDLLEYVSANMPNGAGGSLSAASYNDLVALILKANGFPAGTAEVTPDAVAKVMILPKGGAGELPANTLVRFVGCLSPKSGADWIVTNATVPVRAEKTAALPEDATQALGDRTMTLKFVLTRLDAHIGKRVAVAGLTIGAGGADGINVSTVNRVAESCP
jgi:mono/diheme cytochrome c family protein